MIKFIKRLFRRELGNILKVFDKAHAQLDAYIARTTEEQANAQAAADFHQSNLNTAHIVKGNLTALTSTTTAVTQ
jgi:hypothetical protein